MRSFNDMNMKRILLFLLFLPIASLGIFAQDYNNVRVFEFEMGAGLNHGNIRGYSQSGIKVGPVIFIETRFNLRESPLDIGLQSSIGGSFAKKAKKDSYLYDISTIAVVSAIYLDYNHRKWENVSLFGGLGLGRALFKIDEDQVSHDGTRINGHECNHEIHSLFAFSPRIGAEFFNCIRLTAECKIMAKYSSYYALNVGIVMGGGMKE